MRKAYISKEAKISAKAILLAVYDAGGDWNSILGELNISKKTAYRWLNCSEADADRRGGFRGTKISEMHLEFLTQQVNSNPLITIKELTDLVSIAFPDKSLSRESVRKALDQCLFSIKSVRFESENANLPHNKEKRKIYARSILQHQSANRQIIYMDETNFNIHISRNQGRSIIGERCTVKAAATKGANIHVIGCIGSLGKLNFQIKRGSFKKNEAKMYIEETLQEANRVYGVPVVLVLDNAPAHSNVENEIRPEILKENTILRLGPYSPMLNPIERIWSVVKAYVKRRMAADKESLLTQDRNGLSISEFRLQALEKYIEESFGQVSPELCMRMIASVQSLFFDAIEGNNVSF